MDEVSFEEESFLSSAAPIFEANMEKEETAEEVLEIPTQTTCTSSEATNSKIRCSLCEGSRSAEQNDPICEMACE